MKVFLFLMLSAVTFGVEQTTLLVDQFSNGYAQFYIKTEVGSFHLQTTVIKEAYHGCFSYEPGVYANPAAKWLPGDRLAIERLESGHDFPIKFTNLETQEVAYGTCRNYEHSSLEQLLSRVNLLESKLSQLTFGKGIPTLRP